MKNIQEFFKIIDFIANKSKNLIAKLVSILSKSIYFY